MRLKKRLAIIPATVALTISALYVTMSSQPQAATSLILLFPSTMHPQVAVEITVVAVNDQMQIDPSRDDLIRITLNPESHAKIGLANSPQSQWAKNLTVGLTNGKASFMILGERLEMVIFSAEWIDGRSPLKSLTTMKEMGVD